MVLRSTERISSYVSKIKGLLSVFIYHILETHMSLASISEVKSGNVSDC